MRCILKTQYVHAMALLVPSLEFSNQALAAYIKELIGDEYLHDATKLENC